MGIPVLVMGKSGSGKSTSLRNVDDKFGVINVLGKPLPFKTNIATTATDDYATIAQMLMKSQVNSIVIDDAGYLMTNMFMKGHTAQGAGNGQFQFYNKIGDNFWKLITYVSAMATNKIVYFMMHEDKNDFGEMKPKSIGRMLDEKVCIEGLFTIVLRSVKREGKHQFLTQTDGMDVTKTPLGMFQDPAIDNDIAIVDQAIREYYNLTEGGANA